MPSSEFDNLKEQYWLTYMVHLLSKEYKWSKSQVDEVYPDEAVVLLKIIAFERRDELLQKRLDYYTKNIDAIYIQHAEDPTKVLSGFKTIVEKLQNLQVKMVKASEDSKLSSDDDLPDFEKLKQLKEFTKSRR